MEIAIALLCLAAGGALGWFIAQARSAATAERARLMEAELTAARARLFEIENQNRKSKMNSRPNALVRPKRSPPSPTPTSA